MPDGTVEEAGAYCTVCLDYGGGPRSIAGGRLRVFSPQVTPKMLNDSPQLGWRFQHETPALFARDQLFDPRFQSREFFPAQPDLRLHLRAPFRGPIERQRSQVGC